MTNYSLFYDPPAPIAKIALKKTDSEERLLDVEVILDTGSDVTLLPRTALDDLQFDSDTIQRIPLIAFDGSVIESDTYFLQIDFMGFRFTGRYCAIDEEAGILGRDVLNKVSILFDGPNLEWDTVKD